MLLPLGNTDIKSQLKYLFIVHFWSTYYDKSHFNKEIFIKFLCRIIYCYYFFRAAVPNSIVVANT